MEYKRGDIFFADLGTCNVGSEQSGTRPVVIIQNDIGNRFSPTIIVACVTSRLYKTEIPTHVRLSSHEYQNVIEDSLVLCEQLKTIDKSRLRTRLARLSTHDQFRVDHALRLSLAV